MNYQWHVILKLSLSWYFMNNLIDGIIDDIISIINDVNNIK